MTLTADDLIVNFADGEVETTPFSPGGGSGVDQTARDAAAAAQGAIDAHEATLHNTDQTARDAAATAQGTADGATTAAAAAQADLDAHEATLHNTDATARDAAATAQGTADGAQTAATANADLLAPPTLAEAMKGTATTIRGWSAVLIRAAARAVRPERDEVVDVENGRLPGPPVAMRLGWSQTRTFTALDFDRPTPPIGGSVSGMSSGLAIPPFPPALETDASLFLGLWLAGDPGIAELPSGFAVADKSALTVDGTPGHYFASAMRFSTNLAGDVLKAHLVGPRLLTADDLPGRVTLYSDSSDYSRSTRSTVFRQIPLDRAPARGRGLERVRHRQNQKGDSQGSQKVIQAMSWVKGGQPWMTRPYSEDLRERVVRVVESGTSRNAAAKQFDVSISFVVKLMQRWKQRGTIKADKYGGWKKSKLAPHGDRIRALVMENCDITIDELCVLLAAEGIEAKRSTLGDFLLAQGLSRKKRQPTPPSRSALTSRRREPLGATSNLG